MTRLNNTRLAVLLTAVGIVLTVVAAFTEGYTQNLLIQLGSTSLFAIPLVILERVMSNATQRIEHIEQGVDDLREDIAPLTGVGERIEKRQEEATRSGSELVDRVRTQPNEANLTSLMNYAIRMGAIATNGLSHHVPGSDCYLRVETGDEATRCVLGVVPRKSVSGSRRMRTLAARGWASTESADDVLDGLAQLAHARSVPLKGSQLETAFEGLLASLDGLLADRTQSLTMGRAIACGPDHWVITERGLESFSGAPFVPKHALGSSGSKHGYRPTREQEGELYDLAWDAARSLLVV